MPAALLHAEPASRCSLHKDNWRACSSAENWAKLDGHKSSKSNRYLFYSQGELRILAMLNKHAAGFVYFSFYMTFESNLFLAPICQLASYPAEKLYGNSMSPNCFIMRSRS